MAWTSPRTWLAGEKPSAATLNTHIRDNLKAIGDPMASYSPALTNWVIGNGTLTGKYRAAGKRINGEITLTLGSSSTMVGGFIVSLPVAAGATTSVWHPIGQAALFDTSGTAFRVWTVVLGTTSTTLSIVEGTTTNTIVNQTVPWTWASGDTIRVTFDYEAV